MQKSNTVINAVYVVTHLDDVGINHIYCQFPQCNHTRQRNENKYLENYYYINKIGKKKLFFIYDTFSM